MDGGWGDRQQDSEGDVTFLHLALSKFLIPVWRAVLCELQMHQHKPETYRDRDRDRDRGREDAGWAGQGRCSVLSSRAWKRLCPSWAELSRSAKPEGASLVTLAHCQFSSGWLHSPWNLPVGQPGSQKSWPLVRGKDAFTRDSGKATAAFLGLTGLCHLRLPGHWEIWEWAGVEGVFE